jgi:hypothetical protein
VLHGCASQTNPSTAVDKSIPANDPKGGTVLDLVRARMAQQFKGGQLPQRWQDDLKLCAFEKGKNPTVADKNAEAAGECGKYLVVYSPSKVRAFLNFYQELLNSMEFRLRPMDPETAMAVRKIFDERKSSSSSSSSSSPAASFSSTIEQQQQQRQQHLLEQPPVLENVVIYNTFEKTCLNLYEFVGQILGCFSASCHH